MTCERCATPLRRYQKRYCSIPCHARSMRPVKRDALLAILRGQGSWWLTLSDLAIWLHGDDTWRTCRGVRDLLALLRQDGHRIEQRQASWEPKGGRAYRLIDSSQEMAA